MMDHFNSTMGLVVSSKEAAIHHLSTFYFLLSTNVTGGND